MQETIKECIKKTGTCINREGRNYRLLDGKCCLDEMQEDREIIQGVVDVIEDCQKNVNSLKKIASKLSYATSLINHNNEEDLLEILPLLKRYSMLIFAFIKKILNDENLANLVYSFNIELKKWFQLRFLHNNIDVVNNIPYQSIIADLQTVEMSLGVCIIKYPEGDSLDDMFF